MEWEERSNYNDFLYVVRVTNTTKDYEKDKWYGNQNSIKAKRYVFEIHCDVLVLTPENSLAKTYEDKNELRVILEVPKINERDKNIQELLRGIEPSVNDEGYYGTIRYERKYDKDNYRIEIVNK